MECCSGTDARDCANHVVAWSKSPRAVAGRLWTAGAVGPFFVAAFFSAMEL
jgi:hypothetical protein